MAFIVQDTDLTVASGDAITLVTNDKLVVLEDVTMINEGSSTLDHVIDGSTTDDNIDVFVAGTLIANGGSLIAVYGDNIDVTLAETANLVHMTSILNFGAMSFEGVNVSVTNHGSIASLNGMGMFSGDGNSSIVNTGTIDGIAGLVFYGAQNTVVNSGTITGKAFTAGTPPGVDFLGMALYLRQDNAFITNLEGGFIGTTAADGSAIFFDSAGTHENTVVNAGSLAGGSMGYGIEITNGSSTGVMTIVNSGTISGGLAAIQATTGTDSVDNSGAMVGDVNLGASLDEMFNSGIVQGNVDLGTGDDTYKASGDGSVSGSIVGGDGFDNITGGSSDDEIYGGADADVIRGGHGDDLVFGGSGSDEIRLGAGADVAVMGDDGSNVYGGAGDDVLEGGSGDDDLYGNRDDDLIYGGSGVDYIYGGSGDDIALGGNFADRIEGGSGQDTLYGENGNDTLFGGSGDDEIFGEDGKDTIEGGAGDDIINGGLGQDTMTGGSGEDVFVFNAYGHSSAGTDRDVITDFESGVDTIDLGSFGGTLTFIGTASSFTGAAGEARFNASNGRLLIDQDGNGTTDFSIQLIGVTSLSVDDLIL